MIDPALTFLAGWIGCAICNVIYDWRQGLAEYRRDALNSISDAARAFSCGPSRNPMWRCEGCNIDAQSILQVRDNARRFLKRAK